MHMLCRAVCDRRNAINSAESKIDGIINVPQRPILFKSFTAKYKVAIDALYIVKNPFEVIESFLKTNGPMKNVPKYEVINMKIIQR